MKQHKQIQTILKFCSVIEQKSFAYKDIERLVSAMLTPGEIETLSQRIHVLQMLYHGKSQREISEELGVGVATATRGNRMLRENIDLFEKILKKGH